MKTSSKAGAAGAGAILLAASFIAPWEGLWTTAKIDTVGTNQPPTVCYGATKAEIPTLKVGQKFTKEECDNLLIKSIPKYNDEISKCISVSISDKTRAAYISFAYNVGSGAFCRSQISKKLNAGDPFGSCDAMLAYNHARGRVVKGLTNRRQAERKMCLEGINEPAPTKPAPQKPESFWDKFLTFLKGLPIWR